MSQANSALALSSPYAGQAVVPAQPQGYAYAPVSSQNQSNQPFQNDQIASTSPSPAGMYSSYGAASISHGNKKRQQVKNPGEIVAIATLSIDGLFLLAALAIFNGLPFGKHRGRKPEENHGTIEYRQQRQKTALENFHKKSNLDEILEKNAVHLGKVK